MDENQAVLRAQGQPSSPVLPNPTFDAGLSADSRRPSCDHQAIPQGRGYGKITIREIALFIVVVAVAQRVLPRPLDLLAATSLPAIYFPARIVPRLARRIGLLMLMAILLAPFLPAWHSNESADFNLGMVTALSLAPLLARIATWRCRSTNWDILDPIVIASAPLALSFLFVVQTRLFELGIFSWR